MTKLKRAYYASMYEITDSIMWLFINDQDLNRTHWNRWWNISEAYRAKRDRVA